MRSFSFVAFLSALHNARYAAIGSMSEDDTRTKHWGHKSDLKVFQPGSPELVATVVIKRPDCLDTRGDFSCELRKSCT